MSIPIQDRHAVRLSLYYSRTSDPAKRLRISRIARQRLSDDAHELFRAMRFALIFKVWEA